MTGPNQSDTPKLREWPMFRPGWKQRRAAREGCAPPKISDLIMERVPGTPAEKLAWLRKQSAAGKLAADDPEEIAQAEALLAMLMRVSGSKGGKEKRHLDELLDEGLRETFPASDPVAVGQFTATEPPSRPIDTGGAGSTAGANTKGKRLPASTRRVA